MEHPKTFTVNGVEYPFASDLTLGEARTMKVVYGVRLGELEDLLTAGDPDALAAVVFTSMRRVDPTKTEADVDGVNLSDLHATIFAEVVEVDAEAGDVPLDASAAE